MNERVKAFVESVRNNEIVFPVSTASYLTTGYRGNQWLLDEYTNRPANSNDGLFLVVCGLDLAKGEDYSVECWAKANPIMQANVRENEHS